MNYFDTLMEVEDLVQLVENDRIVLVDARFRFDDHKAARMAYLAGHIPSAVYVDLENDMSGLPATDSGRHPLPTPQALSALFGRLGISNGVQVVIYDNADGAAAARMWWMLRYMGHQAAAVLNGGFPAWKSADHELAMGYEQNQASVFSGQPQESWLVLMQDAASAPLLVDSRAPDRYKGKIEPIDPIAGHIPGAANFYFKNNFNESGRFLPPERLNRYFSDLIGDILPQATTFYCGSGVTACNNVLAMAYSGLGIPRLYVGSWSEWCRDPGKPIATS